MTSGRGAAAGSRQARKVWRTNSRASTPNTARDARWAEVDLDSGHPAVVPDQLDLVVVESGDQGVVPATCPRAVHNVERVIDGDDEGHPPAQQSTVLNGRHTGVAVPDGALACDWSV